MSYLFAEEKNKAAFEEFVLNNGGIYMQSYKWAEVKLEWESKLYSGFDENGNRVLTALVLSRSIPLSGKICYSPAGPVCDYSDTALLEAFTRYITAECKKAGAAAYFIDPCVELRINGEKQPGGRALHNALVNMGYTLNTDASKSLYKAPVQLMLNLINSDGSAYTPEKLLKTFEKGVRYSVRIGENRGLFEKIYTIEDVGNDPKIMADFAAVMSDTSERNDFVERGSEYCERLLSVFGRDNIDVMLIYYDKNADKKLQAERLKRRDELEKALETAPEKKIRGIKEEIESIDKQTGHFEERMRETENEKDDVICVSGGMTLHYNGMSSCLFGGSKNLLRNNLRASHFFNFRRICHSIEKGSKIHDLGYVLLDKTPPDTDGTLGETKPNKEFEGICAFKKSFGSDYVEYVGEYAYVINKAKFYSYSHLLEKVRSVQSVVNRVVRENR